MGRLYWKFFIFFFLAQLTSVIGVGIAFSIERERDEMRRDQAVQMQAPQAPTAQPPHHKPPRHKHGLPVIPVLIGALASLIFAAILAWYFSKPIKQLRNAFDSAANGKLDVRVGASMDGRRDELADLGHDFDVMASRLGALLQSQTRLLHQVSHELRSPLARLQIAVGLARQQPDKIESSLTRIERESERMDDLVGQLLTLSRLESGMIKLEKTSVDVNELLNHVLEDARYEGDAKNIHIEYSSQHQADNKPLQLLGQADLLHRAIDNVVRNALKFSPSPSTITISTHLENNLISITVNDAGPGVAQSELAHIFEPFFRGSQTQKTDGYGVGLAITKQIIEAHGGQIFAQNLLAGGLSVNIRLPRS